MSYPEKSTLAFPIIGYEFTSERVAQELNQFSQLPARRVKLEVFFDGLSSSTFHGEEAVSIKAAVDKIAAEIKRKA